MELQCMLILLFLCVSVCKFVFLYTPPYKSQKRPKIYHLKSNFFSFFCLLFQFECKDTTWGIGTFRFVQSL